MSYTLPECEAAKCFVCSRKGRNFLSCSRCDKQYHQQCLVEGAFVTESNWVCPLHSCSMCNNGATKRSPVHLSVIEYIEKCGSQCMACLRRFCPSHLDQAKSVVLPLDSYGKHFSASNDIILCNDCSQDKAGLNQANKRRKLENGESESSYSSPYAEQSPRRDFSSEADSHSSGENSPRDYKIIFSNYSFATPMNGHKEAVPEPPRKNIKLKFKDCLEFTEEPIRPQADENLITLLREVMRTTKKNQKIVANEIGVSPTTMSSYMNSKSKPTGWNKMERKLKQWITGLEVELPAPRESGVIPAENPTAFPESKEEASTEESRSPSGMNTCGSSWDYSSCQGADIKLKNEATHCMSNYINHVQYQQPTSAYKPDPYTYNQPSYPDLHSHAMEHGQYGHYPPLDQSSVSYSHPFTPACEVDQQAQASFWPPLNLNLNFEHSQIGY